MSADSIKKNLDLINSELPSSVRLVAVSKFKPVEDVAAAYIIKCQNYPYQT